MPVTAHIDGAMGGCFGTAKVDPVEEFFLDSVVSVFAYCAHGTYIATNSPYSERAFFP